MSADPVVTFYAGLMAGVLISSIIAFVISEYHTPEPELSGKQQQKIADAARRLIDDSTIEMQDITTYNRAISYLHKYQPILFIEEKD